MKKDFPYGQSAIEQEASSSLDRGKKKKGPRAQHNTDVCNDGKKQRDTLCKSVCSNRTSEGNVNRIITSQKY
ncbi:CLUMA_CG002196, isoform A [Clunio marinus]|uniref:CLUMA_CG002196, isoform A n=1 Tax=Clunio marinus TaxID=568069 RepID=A0A1J1HPL4_9DIPT|nr:CLUMA_CG002196, isoform A [Clunio marinus]